ncbi:hypothetical protein ACH4UM_33760 [Streptomyces sp. NPDC020801]|uniref:hypothetical protein n=1 Tax=unclassified Streptomyces TaxID=2593676 RepID=UPI0037BC1FBA
MPTPYGTRGGMAFGAEELRVLRRALALALHSRPVRTEDVQDCLRLAESLDEAMREGARLRAFLVADLARYRDALPGTAAGYFALLSEALEAGHEPGPDDLAALRALRGNPTAAALLRRCRTPAAPAVSDPPAASDPPAVPATSAVPGALPAPGPFPDPDPDPAQAPVPTVPASRGPLRPVQPVRPARCVQPFQGLLGGLPGVRAVQTARTAEDGDSGKEPAKKPAPKPAERPAPAQPGPAPAPGTPKPARRPIPTPGEVFPRRKPAPPSGSVRKRLAAV